MTSIFKLPSGVGQAQVRDGISYTADANGNVTVPDKYAGDMRNMGALLVATKSRKVYINKPLAAELIAIKAAAIAVNGAITVAAQPTQPCKLQIRQVIATAITAGTLTLVGEDINGNALSEVVSLIAASTQTLTTTNAFAKLTPASCLVAGLVGGGDGTLGIGHATALSLPFDPGYVVGSLDINKVLVDAVDDTLPATIDTTRCTFVPTTAANGTKNFEVFYTYQVAA